MQILYTLGLRPPALVRPSPGAQDCHSMQTLAHPAPPAPSAGKTMVDMALHFGLGYSPTSLSIQGEHHVYTKIRRDAV